MNMPELNRTNRRTGEELPHDAWLRVADVSPVHETLFSGTEDTDFA